MAAGTLLPLRKLLAPALVAALVAGAAAADETASAPEPRTPRRIELRVQDVGRLALRNAPGYRAKALDPEIARTFEQEALGAFDRLFTSRAGFGERRSEVFFDLSEFGGRPGASSDAGILDENYAYAGAGLGAREEWGGQWRVGYDATSTERSGALSVTSLEPRFDGLLSAEYTHPLLRGAGRDVQLAEVNRARRLTRDAELALAREAETTVAQAEQIYWDLVGALADRDLRRKSVDVARELLETVRARVEAGRGIPVDLTEATAGLARREVDLISGETAVENLSDRLRELVLPFTGEAPDLDAQIVPTDQPAAAPPEAPPAPGEREIAAALAQRADVLAAEERVEAARILQRRAADDTLAQLDAVLSGGLRGLGSGFSQSSTKIGEGRAPYYEAGLELSVPLGDRAAEARLRRAAYERERRERELAALCNSVVRELREAARNTRSAADRIVATQRSSAAAREQLGAERSRLEIGRATPFDVLQVEEELTGAAAAEIQARVDFEKARVELLRAQGLLLETRALEDVVATE